MQMHVDNQAAIRQLEGETSSLKSKHIDVRFKFIKDITRRRIVEPRYVRSELIIADLLTKPVDQHKLSKLRGLVGPKLDAEKSIRPRGGVLKIQDKA